jgi:hypothetical protein
MKSGRPIIVADAGFYAELPNDLVFKVPSSVDGSSLTNVLERLVSDEDLRRETGAKARDWALRTFTAEAYVAILEGLMSQFIDSKPLLRVGQRIGQELASLGVVSGDPAIEQVAKKMNGLFGGDLGR